MLPALQHTDRHACLHYSTLIVMPACTTAQALCITSCAHKSLAQQKHINTLEKKICMHHIVHIIHRHTLQANTTFHEYINQ
jgi:hypothetical protein